MVKVLPSNEGELSGVCCVFVVHALSMSEQSGNCSDFAFQPCRMESASFLESEDCLRNASLFLQPLWISVQAFKDCVQSFEREFICFIAILTNQALKRLRI